MKINREKLLSIIEKNKIAIYGYGYVACEFYSILKANQLNENVEYFITSKIGDKKSMFGIEIIQLDKLKKSDCLYIFIAVHETWLCEIEMNLKESGFKNYIWIHPYIYMLQLGNPIDLKKRVLLSQIWKANRQYYSLAIRIAVIEQYYKKNTYGFELYEKWRCLVEEPKTASKRLKNFVSLIENWEKNGYDDKYTSVVLDNAKIIDGTHRISLAMYHDQYSIYCEIYPNSKRIEEIHSKQMLLAIDEINKMGFSKNELERLRQVNMYLDHRFLER